MRFHPFVFTGKERDEKTGFGFTTTYTYDLRGRLTATAHPDKGTTTLTYDKAGNLTHKATQKLANQGVDIEYVYDYNRLKEVHYPLLPQNNLTYTYGTSSNTGTNACGRLLRVDDGTGYQDRLGNVVENTRAIALPFEDSVYNFLLRRICNPTQYSFGISNPNMPLLRIIASGNELKVANPQQLK